MNTAMTDAPLLTGSDPLLTLGGMGDIADRLLSHERAGVVAGEIRHTDLGQSDGLRSLPAIVVKAR
jgi:hypothetical protein